MNRRMFFRGLLATVIAPLARVPIVGPILKPRQIGASMSVADELVLVTQRAFLPKIYVDLWKESPLMKKMLEGIDK